MKEIKLSSKKYPNKVALVDDMDFDYLNQFTWGIYKVNEKTSYAYRVTSRKLNNGKQVTVSMHREILGLTNPKIFVDHEDHNGLNNQRNNIRVATPAQNAYNRTSHADSNSKYKGVHLDKYKKVYKGKEKVYCYWRAVVGFNNKLFRIGNFKSEKEAALAYNKKAIELHGDFANLNKI